MKKMLTAVFVLLTCAVYAQQQSLQSITWVSDNFGTLSFMQKGRLYWELDQSFKLYFKFLDNDLHYYQSKDTLIVVDAYPRVTRHVKYQVLYKFMITRQGNESLSLTPVNADAKQAVPISPYVLKNVAYVDDPSIKFTNIHYDYGGSPEPVYPEASKEWETTINIDADGNCYLKKILDGNPSHIGYFKGKLNAQQLDSINYFLRHAEIRKLHSWQEKIRGDHSIQRNVVISFNDDVLKIKAGFQPGVLGNLLAYIDSLAKKAALEPDEQKHDFKQEDDLNNYK